MRRESNLKGPPEVQRYLFFGLIISVILMAVSYNFDQEYFIWTMLICIGVGSLYCGFVWFRMKIHMYGTIAIIVGLLNILLVCCFIWL